jgi:hypothetical protein
LAIFAVILRASSLLSNLAATQHQGVINLYLGVLHLEGEISDDVIGVAFASHKSCEYARSKE